MSEVLTNTVPGPKQAPPAEAGQMHVDPYKAAKQIRTLARSARERFTYFKPGGPNDQVTNSLMYVQSQGAWVDEANRHIAQLERAITNRKPTERAEAIQEIKHSLDRVSNLRLKAVEQLRKKPAVAPENDENAKAIQKALQEIHRLAQALPTTSQNPLTPSDNILRAIAVVLCNGGYAKPK